METVHIKIKCPYCGKVLIVQDDPSNAVKNVLCPACNHKNPYTAFRIINSITDEDKTELPERQNDDMTDIRHDFKAMNIGFLLDEKSRRKYPLDEGSNLVGRQPSQTVAPANVAIITDDAGLSRKHLYIDVVKGMDGSIRHWASNAENKNPTFINGRKLDNGDKVLLRDGCIISSSSIVLSFHLD